MDNSPVAAPSGSVQDQNNSKSTSKLESSQMETSEENPAHGSSASKTQSDTVNSEEPAKSPENTTEEKPPAFMPTEETKAETEQESQQTITASNLYPVLSDESEVTPKTDLDSITEQVANASSETEAHNSHASSLPEGKKSSESVPDEQSAHSTSAESLKKDESREKAEISESQRLPAAAPVTEAESAQSTLKNAADGAEAPESLPSTSQYGAEAEAPASEGVTAAASAAAEEGAVGGKNSSPANGESVYYVKWINFNNGRVPVITQNENGPCPLLAIVNVLLLKGKVRLASIVEMITSEQLMAHLGECVVESKPKNLDETHRANYEQNMQDAMDMMHKLQTGLDVNVKFTGVSDFEYTSECIIFDLLQLALYHGWLVDPQNEEEVKAVGKCSYNQLVEKIIQYKQSDKEEMVREALIAEQFLDRTAAQLTYHGLCELSSTVKEQELCVFFRNNHFNTLLRHNNTMRLQNRQEAKPSRLT
ncbi:hypothetical protein V1264_024945 [Littorina saxatilis]|uniref:Ubiquitin carboxyl-terminal hydrolase n=1 Tax=Littorina saxatilis TaxID=31220 RepID=A0AAN9FXX2_9CAEN